MEQRTDDPPTVDPIRVVLVDDHTMFRHGLRQALAQHGIDVIGEASNGRAGARLVAELKPDVVVMDLHMPLLGGIEAAREIIAADPTARILTLTVSTDEDEVLEALMAGTSGYVLKSSPASDVVRAIRATYDGDSTISPEVATRLVDRLRTISARGSEPEAPSHPLTARELEILRLIAEGRENHEIAQALVISPSTAKNHVARVLDKLGLDNRVQAAVYAVRAGLV